MKKYIIYIISTIVSLILFAFAIGISTRLTGEVQYEAMRGFLGDISRTWIVWLSFICAMAGIWIPAIKSAKE